MTKLRHVGLHPTHPIELLDFKRKLYIEDFPDGTYKIWNKRQLNSGCGKTVPLTYMREMRGCIYCPWCDEWFSKKQWLEE